GFGPAPDAVLLVALQDHVRPEDGRQLHIGQHGGWLAGDDRDQGRDQYRSDESAQSAVSLDLHRRDHAPEWISKSFPLADAMTPEATDGQAHGRGVSGGSHPATRPHSRMAGVGSPMMPQKRRLTKTRPTEHPSKAERDGHTLEEVCGHHRPHLVEVGTT